MSRRALLPPAPCWRVWPDESLRAAANDAATRATGVAAQRNVAVRLGLDRKVRKRIE